MKSVFIITVTLFFLIVGCGDVNTLSSLVVRNTLDSNVSIYYHFRYSGNNVSQKEDSIIQIEPLEDFVWLTSERLGVEDYVELEDFLSIYDSLVAIAPDSTISTSYLSEDKWIFEEVSRREGLWILLIEKDDFVR